MVRQRQRLAGLRLYYKSSTLFHHGAPATNSLSKLMVIACGLRAFLLVKIANSVLFIKPPLKLVCIINHVPYAVRRFYKRRTKRTVYFVAEVLDMHIYGVVPSFRA
jgi:hypothetical protein